MLAGANTTVNMASGGTLAGNFTQSLRLDLCRAGDLKDRSMHGLRKAAARRVVEFGLSNQITKSIHGHTSDAEAARHTREAEQKKMAELAMQALRLG